MDRPYPSPHAGLQVRDTWAFRMTARYADYAALLQRYLAPRFAPQVVPMEGDAPPAPEAVAGAGGVAGRVYACASPRA